MRGRIIVLAISLAAAGLVSIAPANAKPIDKGHFHDVETNFFDCDGTPVQEDVDVKGSFTFNQRGTKKHPFPYFHERVRGTVAWTNLNSGGTLTNVFAANRQDHTIVDNGDGTITIYQYAAGGSRYYDKDGNKVLMDPGEIRFAFEVDYNGTPGNPDDDVEVEGSFRTVRDSTGRNDTEGRDFCADVVEFTT